MGEKANRVKSLRLSNEGIEQARLAFDRLAISQDEFVTRLGIEAQRVISRKTLGKFLRGEAVRKDCFALFCQHLGLEVARVVATTPTAISEVGVVGFECTGGASERAISSLNYLLDNLDTPPSLHVRHVRSSEELHRLWAIDAEAYGASAITLATFYNWWERFDPGLKAVFEREKLVGAFGIWPLDEMQADKLEKGQISESELLPCTYAHCREHPCPIWYVSGIVLDPTFRTAGSRAIQPLLSVGLGLWLESFLVAYPLKVLAVASSVEGERMLERFAFVRRREGHQMVDGHPLFGLRASSKGDLSGILARRGLG